MKDIKKVEIVFENCEEVTIERKYIEKLNALDIEICEDYNVCNSFEIEINKDILDNTDDKGLCNRYFENCEDKVSIGERLQQNDITQIHICYEDDSKEWFYVNWEDSDSIFGIENINQESDITQNDNLYIVIR